MGTCGIGNQRKLAVVIGMLATFSVTGGFDCPGGPPEPMIQLYHFPETEPWRKEYNFNNIHSSKLCSPTTTSCFDTDPGYCPGTPYNERVDILNMQSLDSYMGVDDKYWNRDRIMFFENCGPGCRAVPGINRSDGTARTGGYYRYKEGTGPVYNVDPLLMGRSVGHIRRYRRGKCSAEMPLNNIDISHMIANAFRDRVECSDSIWSTRILDSYAELFIGTSDCNSVNGEDQDYIHIYWKVLVEPAHYLANAYFTYEQDIWMQVGARRRVQLLNCPEQGECPSDVCEDCNKECAAVACRNDWGCCDIPGAVCTDTAVYGAECNSDGYCEKKSFLDIIDYQFSHDWDMTRACAWDWWCWPTAIGFWASVGISPLRDIFYPLIQQLYDMMWQKPNPDEWWLFPCTANDDAVCRTWQDENIQGRCDVGNGVCEFRPMSPMIT